MMMKFLKCLRLTEELDICHLIPETINIRIMEVIIVVTLVYVDLGDKIPATLSSEIVKFIIFLMVIELELDLKRPVNHTLAMV